MKEKNIVDLIGRRISLKKKESTYWGMCPFCKPSTVTFAVHKETNKFRCYCCNANGGAEDFLKLYEN